MMMMMMMMLRSEVKGDWVSKDLLEGRQVQVQ